jgi:hypothetical protein
MRGRDNWMARVTSDGDHHILMELIKHQAIKKVCPHLIGNKLKKIT